MFKGTTTALVTPFKDGKVDLDAFCKFVEWQIEQGVHGLLVCGTTGETPTISFEERDKLVRACVETAAKRVPVMVGTGSYSTEQTIKYTKHALEAGADAALVVAPYYNKPTQEGLYQHYKAVNDAVDIPQYIYNIPGRSVINIFDETIARLSKLPNIKGIKDATEDIIRPLSLKMQLGDNDNFLQLTGADANSLAFNANGGEGCISVTANVAPKLCREMQDLSLNGDYKEALDIHKKLMPLHTTLFCETNPAPVKYAASVLGLMSDEVRLPMVRLQDDSKEKVMQALKAVELV